ncbi:hypothetical protein KIW84_013412 [Lathyrus oleraceus]|uniref:Uncharacterized protein n=1 Tax=Pisum sativum TaxID=3888 RepID=A0A9D5GY31_PEA|nr:hypothetical protein KIW84_013412 [Pisum sativum]
MYHWHRLCNEAMACVIWPFVRDVGGNRCHQARDAGIMDSKRGCMSRGSSSRASPTPSALTFPNLKFLSEAHAEKFLKIVDYHIMKERTFDLNYLRGFEEIGEHLQRSQWVSFNNLIREKNKSIGLEFYANAAFGVVNSYTSYVPGKYIEYSPFTINFLFNLQSPPVYALLNYRREHRVINDEMA